ncbi:hypothetical protein [Halofilum ochraceum]|nr:hypothetical protein [Halofilum ochraceum]
MFTTSDAGGLAVVVCLLIGIPTMIWGDVTTGFFVTAAGFGLGTALR